MMYKFLRVPYFCAPVPTNKWVWKRVGRPLSDTSVLKLGREASCTAVIPSRCYSCRRRRGLYIYIYYYDFYSSGERIETRLKRMFNCIDRIQYFFSDIRRQSNFIIFLFHNLLENIPISNRSFYYIRPDGYRLVCRISQQGWPSVLLYIEVNSRRLKRPGPCCCPFTFCRNWALLRWTCLYSCFDRHAVGLCGQLVCLVGGCYWPRCSFQFGSRMRFYSAGLWNVPFVNG